MATSQSDVTTVKGEETAVLSQAGFQPPTPAELAARFPNLEVTELLGHGGMGLVYKGRQPFLDRLVAIKVIRPDLQDDDSFQERFLREARTLAKLRHPFIVTVFEVFKADDLYCLVMEYVEGVSLRQLLAGGSITQRDALDFVQQVTQALQHAHEAGVVHRDIKPENVLVDALRSGPARRFRPGHDLEPAARTRPADDDRVVGTLRYMAPEQIATPQAVDHRADIYSTGVVFYEMLAHELPATERIPPSRKAATDPRLDPIVLRAIEPERERRYQQAQFMHQDITRPGAHARIDDSHREACPRSTRAGVRGVARPGRDGRLVCTLGRLRPDHRRGRCPGRRPVPGGHALARHDRAPIRFRTVLPDRRARAP